MSEQLSRDQLVDLVRKIMDVDGTEQEIDSYIRVVQQNVPHPSISDLIFYPEGGDPTAEEVVDEALSYRPR